MNKRNTSGGEFRTVQAASSDGSCENEFEQPNNGKVCPVGDTSTRPGCEIESRRKNARGRGKVKLVTYRTRPGSRHTWTRSRSPRLQLPPYKDPAASRPEDKRETISQSRCDSGGLYSMIGQEALINTQRVEENMQEKTTDQKETEEWGGPKRE